MREMTAGHRVDIQLGVSFNIGAGLLKNTLGHRLHSIMQQQIARVELSATHQRDYQDCLEDADVKSKSGGAPND